MHAHNEKLSRIHIFGASGSGTTSLGGALASKLGVLHLDVDEFYWQKTDPPFQIKNEPEQRVAAIRAAIGDRTTWVLSGSIVSWGGSFVDEFTCALFLELEPEERMRRLRARDVERYGERILPGGALHSNHLAFMEWAQAYDVASDGIRCRPVHLKWMAQLACPVLRLDSLQSVQELVAEVLSDAV